MSNPCNARILTNAFKVGTTTLYETKECRKPATKHVWVDDADARMYICGKCIYRWLTQGFQVSKWYGWFDCEIPPQTPVFESPFYMDILRKEFGNLTLQEFRKKVLDAKGLKK